MGKAELPPFLDDMEKEKTKLKLDDRLKSAAGFIRQGAVVADVGTDHGYRPIVLINAGHIPFAVATDIREGPLDRARRNARKYGAEDRMKFELSDGLEFLGTGEYAVDDIVICGMGGETIASIIAASGYAIKKDVRLILQPMTKACELRKYLYSSGFDIEEETLSESGGKIYSCMLVRYTGDPYDASFAEKMLGKRNIEKKEALFARYAAAIRNRLLKQARGMEKGGGSAAELRENIREIEDLIDERTGISQ